MTLDLLTLRTVATAVVVLVSALYLTEAWQRRSSRVDRLWSLAFMAAIATALASVAIALVPGMWWARAVANGANVMIVWAMWNGVRAYAGQRPMAEATVAVAAAASVAVLLQGPDGGFWAGGGALLGGLAAGGLLAGGAALRGPLRHCRSGRILAALGLTVGAFYLLRLLLYLTVGPDSEVFATYVGTELTTVILILLVTGAAFCMVSVRNAHDFYSLMLGRSFDPVTGARTPASFEGRAADRLRHGAERAEQMCMVVVIPQDLTAIEEAFGRPYSDRALELYGEVLRLVLPPRALMGFAPGSSIRFQVLLPEATEAEAEAWCAELRKEVVSTPFELPDGSVRLAMSMGVACVDQHGYELREVCEAATAAAEQALDRGGNRLVTAPKPAPQGS